MLPNTLYIMSPNHRSILMLVYELHLQKYTLYDLDLGDMVTPVEVAKSNSLGDALTRKYII